MKLKVKDMDISTGRVQVILLNQKDAHTLDLHHGDRVIVKKGKKKTIAMLDIAESKKAVAPGNVGLFEEVLDVLGAKHKDEIDLDLTEKPKTVNYIKDKLDGRELKVNEIKEIIQDIVSNKLTELELCYFIAGCYTSKLSKKETTALAKAIVESGERLVVSNGIIVDKHCTGGIPGNRTTMIVIPICIAAGLKFPKTSSRSITSPSGTADTMEVLAPISIPVKKLKNIIKKVGGFIVWGGGINLAIADDKLIKLRHPLSLDPEGMLLASILAKKAAVGATHVLIDIPLGPNTKIKSKKKAKSLKKAFISLGKTLKMKVKVIITNGKEPIGHGIGPNLEARDVLWVLKNDVKAPSDLRKKSLFMASKILKMAGITKPKETAQNMLTSGLAYKKMQEIIKAQGGNPYLNPDKIKIGKYSHKIKANKTGKIKLINTKLISKIARIAGAPLDTSAGIYLYHHTGYKIKKGETLFVIYATSREKLKYALNIYRKNQVIEIK